MSSYNKVSSKSSTSSISDESYWADHVKLKRASGLSRAQYCRNNNLKCHQLEYWEHKLISKQTNTQLLPIKIIANEKVAIESKDSNSSKLLCKLKLKNGSSLKIYEETVLPIILNNFM
jgi:hypothetical protein